MIKRLLNELGLYTKKDIEAVRIYWNEVHKNDIAVLENLKGKLYKEIERREHYKREATRYYGRGYTARQYIRENTIYKQSKTMKKLLDILDGRDRRTNKNK